MSVTAKRLARLGHTIYDTIETHSDLVADALRQSSEETGEPIDYQPVFEGLLRLIEGARVDMVVADERHERALDGALLEASLGNFGTQRTEAERDRTLRGFRDVLIASARAAESLFFLAGRPELAAYIRLARRRAVRWDAGGDEPLRIPDPLDAPTDSIPAHCVS